MTEELHDLAPFYVLDGLDEADRVRFEAHLVDCSACRAEVAGLLETLAAMDNEPVEPVPDQEPRTELRPIPRPGPGPGVDEEGAMDPAAGASAAAGSAPGGVTLGVEGGRHVPATRRLSLWLIWAAVVVAVVAAILILLNR